MFHVKQLTTQRGLRFVYVVAIGCLNIIPQLACYASKVKAHRAIRYLDGVMVDIDSSHCALIFKADCWFCTHDYSPVLDWLNGTLTIKPTLIVALKHRNEMLVVKRHAKRFLQALIFS